MELITFDDHHSVKYTSFGYIINHIGIHKLFVAYIKSDIQGHIIESYEYFEFVYICQYLMMNFSTLLSIFDEIFYTLVNI